MAVAVSAYGPTSGYGANVDKPSGIPASTPILLLCSVAWFYDPATPTMAGWTLAPGSNVWDTIASPGAANSAVFYLATTDASLLPSSWAINVSPGADSLAQVVAFTGADLTSPIGDMDTALLGIGAAFNLALSVTPTLAGSMVLVTGGAWDFNVWDATTNATPTGLTQIAPPSPIQELGQYYSTSSPTAGVAFTTTFFPTTPRNQVAMSSFVINPASASTPHKSSFFGVM